MKDKKCIDILELDYDCPKCGIVKTIYPTTDNGNQTIKCGECDTYIRLNGKTIDKPAYIVKREEIDKEYNKLKEETSSFFGNTSVNSEYVSFQTYSQTQNSYSDKIGKMRILCREREAIGYIKVVKFCDCGCHKARTY